MAPASRPQYHLDLGSLPQMNTQIRENKSGSSTAASSPVEPPQGSSARFQQSENVGLASHGSTAAAAARRGAGSPSNDVGGGSRFYPRRARELQSEGTSSRTMWGPPTASGLSTPLRETIPESPGDDTFPDIDSAKVDSTLAQRTSSLRRNRAGTVPSQFPALTGSTSFASAAPGSAKSSSRPTPSTSPFRPGQVSSLGRSNSSASASGKSALLSRIRAGSLPQRAGGLSNSSPFGPSLFSTSWQPTRDRANTHTGNHSIDPTSPSDSAFQRDFSDIDVKTLDYLGLDDRNYQRTHNDSFSSPNYGGYPSSSSTIQPLLANFSGANRSNRFRSYSVNAKEKYAAEEDEAMEYPNYYSGTITPSAEYAAAALAATQAEIHQHNLDVQAFANQASSSRPRARTAGVLDKPSSRMWRSFGPSPSSKLGLADSIDTQDLTNAVQAMQLQSAKASLMGDFDGDTVAEATRALWLGGIPTSTTPSSLKAIFEAFGKIESARVLTHKSCGFVNFESIDSAVRAKAHFNGKEIFPGAGPVRIGYAKAPSAAGTPAGNNPFPSQSPDPYGQSKNPRGASPAARDRASTGASRAPEITPPTLRELVPDMLSIVRELGASDEDAMKISDAIEQTVAFDNYHNEIPPITEPTQNRMFDAPKLREIRKRIDNQSCPPAELEEIALSMLPEIAELSSDYLGNTVVQKLFEFCTEPVKETMLREIAPHLAEIGVHKNGTWAAQKIIDMARTPEQMGLIVENIRPYAAASFLDQYGNYVMQCCLRFGLPFNAFIFDSMLCRLWQIAQGRFGARAMRACLESHHATKDQQRILAALIALHGVQLSTNANGALLLTWFLDTCNFPQRRKVLAPRLIPHLVHLCTHKVAYLTVLKIINQRNEPEARDLMLEALFFTPEDRVLEEILLDQQCGATLIFKVLTTPFFEDSLRSKIVDNVRRVLLKIKAQPSQGYKRLMDEVGLSTRGNAQNGRDGNQRDVQAAANGAYGFSPGVAQTPNARADAGMGYDQFGPGTPPGLYQPAAQNPMQMQQAMLAQGRAPMGYGQPAGYGQGPVDHYRMPRTGPSYGGMDPVLMQNGGGYGAPQQYGQSAGWQPQYANGYVMPQQQMHGKVMNGNGSYRGRVSSATLEVDGQATTDMQPAVSGTRGTALSKRLPPWKVKQ